MVILRSYNHFCNPINIIIPSIYLIDQQHTDLLTWNKFRCQKLNVQNQTLQRKRLITIDFSRKTLSVRNKKSSFHITSNCAIYYSSDLWRCGFVMFYFLPVYNI